MTNYKVAVGHDVGLDDLEDIDPQPATPGMLFTRRTYAASGRAIDEYPYVPFQFSMIESVAQYQSVLGQFGLLALETDTTAPVSVYVQDREYNWVVRNGIAVAPEPGPDGQRSNYFLRDFVILIKSLQAQA